MLLVTKHKMIYSWRKIILWTLSFRRRKETHKKFASVKITKLENFYIRSERKLEFINADYLARARLGSIFRHERGRIQEKKEANRYNVISIFSYYCHALRADCTTRRNAYACRILWYTFFAKYRKAAHLTMLCRMRALFCIETSRHLEGERGKRYLLLL